MILIKSHFLERYGRKGFRELDSQETEEASHVFGRQSYIAWDVKFFKTRLKFLLIEWSRSLESPFFLISQ